MTIIIDENSRGPTEYYRAPERGHGAGHNNIVQAEYNPHSVGALDTLIRNIYATNYLYVLHDPRWHARLLERFHYESIKAIVPPIVLMEIQSRRSLDPASIDDALELTVVLSVALEIISDGLRLNKALGDYMEYDDHDSRQVNHGMEFDTGLKVFRWLPLHLMIQKVLDQWSDADWSNDDWSGADWPDADGTDDGPDYYEYARYGLVEYF